MGTQPPIPSNDLLWKQYELHVGLYKTYLDLTLKFNIFYYAATGGLLSYYFSKPDIPWMKYSLLFPIAMSIGFSLLFMYGAIQSRVTRREMFDIRDRLGLDSAPEYHVLALFLWISAALMIVVALSLIGVMRYVNLPAPAPLNL